jgi:DNA-binding NarL/FixJ family response regulator
VLKGLRGEAIRPWGGSAIELRRLVAERPLDHEATRGRAHRRRPLGPSPSRRRRRTHPGVLTDREVEVLRLAALGLTTREIAERVYISPKTADHHIQHVYTKIAVSTRAGAALWAIENELV